MTDDLKAPERLCYVNCGLPDDQCACYRHVMGCDPADRIATLEAALADMTRQRDAAIKSLADVREETIRLNTATDAQYAKTVAKLREERDAAMAAAEAQAEARGMRKAADRAQEIANAAREVGLTLKMGSKAQIEIMERCWGAEDDRMAITTLADATEAAAKGGV